MIDDRDIQIYESLLWGSSILTQDEDEFWNHYMPSVPYTVDVDITYKAWKDKIWANKKMHEMHLKNPEIRSLAIKEIGIVKGTIIKVVSDIYEDDDYSKFSDKLEDILKYFKDDITIEYYSTMYYCHKDYKKGYREFVCAHIHYAHKETGKKVKEILEKEFPDYTISY